jgi:hypothetical protein
MGDGVHALLSGDDGRVGGVLLPNVAISVAQTAADHELTPNRMPLHRHRESPDDSKYPLQMLPSWFGSVVGAALGSGVHGGFSRDAETEFLGSLSRAGLRQAIPRVSMTEWPAT